MELSSEVFEQLGISHVKQPDERSEVSGEFIFNTKVIGVTLQSETGRKRQKLVRKLRKGDVLHLEPDHRDDDYANDLITVLNSKKQDIGYLPSRHGAVLRDEFEAGLSFFAKVQNIKGGMFQDKVVDIGIYKKKDIQH
ncbi:MAG: hypothetical protein WEC12_01690 [Balneolaceae bacterium]